MLSVLLRRSPIQELPTLPHSTSLFPVVTLEPLGTPVRQDQVFVGAGVDHGRQRRVHGRGISSPATTSSTSARSMRRPGDPGEQFPTSLGCVHPARRHRRGRKHGSPLARSETQARPGRRAASELPALSGTPEPQAHRERRTDWRGGITGATGAVGNTGSTGPTGAVGNTGPRARLTRHRIPMPPPRSRLLSMRTSSR